MTLLCVHEWFDFRCLLTLLTLLQVAAIKLTIIIILILIQVFFCTISWIGVRWT